MRTLFILAIAAILASTSRSQTTPDANDVRGVQLTIESSTLPEADRKEIARIFRNQTYETIDELSPRLRDALQVRGYFTASVGNPKISFISQGRGGKIADIHISVEEGPRYRLGEIRFRGGTAFSAEEMRRAIPIQAGELFNVEKMREGIHNLRNLYDGRGYINFTPVPDTATDDTRHIVDINFDLDEGRQFMFGPLVLDGTEPHIGAGRALLESWKSLRGEPYSPHRLQQWLAENRLNLPATAEKHMESSQDDALGIITVRLWFP